MYGLRNAVTMFVLIKVTEELLIIIFWPRLHVIFTIKWVKWQMNERTNKQAKERMNEQMNVNQSVNEWISKYKFSDRITVVWTKFAWWCSNVHSAQCTTINSLNKLACYIHKLGVLSPSIHVNFSLYLFKSEHVVKWRAIVIWKDVLTKNWQACI